MPNGHGGVPGYGLALIFGIATVVIVGASLPEPSPVAQGLAFLFAALCGWRLSFYVFLWDALDYGGGYTSKDEMRRARRRYFTGSIVFAALAVGAVYAVTRSQAENSVAIAPLLAQLGERIVVGVDALLAGPILARVGGLIVAGFGALIVISNWSSHWFLLTHRCGINPEEQRSPVPIFGPACLLAGGAIFGEPVSTWLGQGWWVLALFIDIHTDWLLVQWMRRSLGFGATGDSTSDADRAGPYRRARPARRISAALAAIAVLFIFEQSWTAATLEGFIFYFFGILSGCIFALLPVTSAGKDFLKLIFGYEDNRAFEGTSLLFWVLLVGLCSAALLAIAGSFTNRSFFSGPARPVDVPVVAKLSGLEWGGIRRLAYRVEVTMDTRPGMREVTLPMSMKDWQEVQVGDTIQVLAVPGLWGPEVIDISPR